MAEGAGLTIAAALVVPWAIFWGAMVYAVLQAGATPVRHPRRVTERKGRILVAAGASVTHGKVSHDWVTELDARLGDEWTCLNLGYNGRRAGDVLRTIDGVIALKPDAVVVMVGVNDVNGFTPLDRYRAALTRIVERLRGETHAAIGLCTLTAIGDNLEASVMERAASFNQVVREVAAASKVTCIDVAADQIAWLEADRRPGRWGMLAFPMLMLSAVFQHYALRRPWDAISRTHGLRLTTDLVHQNSTGGQMVTDRVEAFVRKIPPK